jgi:prevent-host-death family protein
MKQASLVHAKAHLSELVDLAEHRGRTVIILRHGKPAAAIVPVAMATPRPARERMTDDELETFWDGFGSDQAGSALADLSEGRSRLDR